MLRRFVVAAIVRSEASYPGVPRAGGVVTGAFAAAPWCIVRTNLSSTQSGALTPLRCGLERHFVRASLREPRQLGQFLAAAAQGAGSTDRARGVTSTALNAGPANSIARVDPARPKREAENPRAREVALPTQASPRTVRRARRQAEFALARRNTARLTRQGLCGPRGHTAGLEHFVASRNWVASRLGPRAGLQAARHESCG